MGKKKALYQPRSNQVYKLSRSNIQTYLECPHCFYLEAIYGLKKPPGLPLPINMAIDSILKKEFDHYRLQAQPHPEVEKILKIKYTPYGDEPFYQWRKEASVFHKETNFNIIGKFDDVWKNPNNNQLFLADYKSGAVSNSGEFTLHESFRNQMDIYLWIGKQLHPNFSETTFFYYKKLQKDESMNKSHFITEIVEYPADDRWVEEIIIQIKDTLESSMPPSSNKECKQCQYVQKRKEI